MRNRKDDALLGEVFSLFIPMLYPFIPHAAEELWEMTGRSGGLSSVKWPSYIEELTARDEVELVFQVNGKIRAKVQAPSSISKDESGEDGHVEREGGRAYCRQKCR